MQTEITVKFERRTSRNSELTLIYSFIDAISVHSFHRLS